MIGSLLTGLFALGVCTQMVQPVFAAPAAAVEGGAKISIANFEFTPGEITIAPGESVTWTNDDGAPHGLVYQDGAKGTELLLPGASFRRQFDRPGTYDYSCAVASLYDRPRHRACAVSKMCEGTKGERLL